MRILVAGPAKTGNIWLTSLLASIYDLTLLLPHQKPRRPQLPLFDEWVAAGGFPDGTVFHQHYDYSPELAAAIAAVPAQAVTIIRDPYDMFVSSYFTLQEHKDDGDRTGRRMDLLIDKPLDHPDVLAFLRLNEGGVRGNMLRAKGWLESGRAAVVRYEDLHRDPVGALDRLTASIAPVARQRLERAVEACSAETIRQRGGAKAKHVRAATVGDSKQRLTDAHLAIFRERHADLIRALGYEVR